MNKAIAPASVIPSSSMAVLDLAVEGDDLGVDRLVALPTVRVDAELPEQRVHAERARLVGHDRHDQPADRRIAHQAAQRPTSTCVVATSRPVVSARNSSKIAPGGGSSGRERTTR
ncbi:MAG: hypothetical protein U1F09_16635 [Steroidobacteraceae bacterium]